ncbi:folate-binding protein YgfZ [Idiomarina sp. A28L]|uniref:tRNA-modifying protein YgfZ n=1 Tax=Idiomarina sp. A28L TaxID=1036674 RepID=UPI000213875D|nr:tRNA-modifying protein YgfZ [Idiomarina sp. A28L]EGN75671.1 folate-binding protein YgfZ [Idiomarina sp. A28L]
MSGLLPENLAQAHPAIFIDLPNLGLISATGPDTQSFLQGQLTCDLKQLQPHNWLLGSHCDAKGKLWSIFRAIRFGEGISLIQNKSTIEKSLSELRKFSVFNKIELNDTSEQHRFFMVAGKEAAAEVATLTGVTPNNTHLSNDSIHALRLMPWAYLCVVPSDFEINNELAPETYWHAMQIEQGWPNFESIQQETFIPQMLNLDTLAGISFKKGCYIGQETIARTHYKGQNKRRLIRLIGEAKSTPAPADQLEIQLGENWRRAGAVISAVRYDNDVIAIQAVLPSDLEAQAKLRIKGQDDSKFTPCLESDETESINE